MQSDKLNISYVLITPARNEEAYIEKTIQSVTSQTVLPKKWVIVSDGSTDRTDEIATSYLSKNLWIEFLKMPERTDRQYAAKVICFNAGYERVKNLAFDILGNLDADITFENDYLEFLLSKFAEFPQLGVAGTPYVEGSSLQYDFRFTSIHYVSGACQMFRRQCYEAVGGYVPIKEGGVDFVAVTTARMKGWMTRTFTEKTCLHHRKMGTGNTDSLMRFFRHGTRDYSFGNHPLWEVFRVLYQMSRKPYFVRGVLLFLGYMEAWLRKADKRVSRELVEFIRAEQMERLQRKLLRL